MMERKNTETIAAEAAKTATKTPMQARHVTKLPVMIPSPSQTAGGYIFLRSPVTTEDNSLSISGVMVSSMTESLEDAYKTSRTNRTDKTAAARLLCFILEEMPVITAPARIDAVMGIRGRASMLKTPRI